MIRQARVEDISKSRVTKRHGRVYVVTRYYPRFLKKNLIDAYYGVLAPSKELLAEFKEQEDEMADDHDGAFEAMDYQSKFTLSEEGLARLREISEESQTKTVYFVCHCTVGQYCHREILMILAHELFGAKISTLSHPYETFRKRIGEFRKR